MGAFEDLKPEDPRQVGRFQVVARLGAGGMGQVYLARSPGGRSVAVKVVRPELARDREFRRRFAREVNAARRVNGAFTAGVVDADPDGSPAWLATVYVPGLSLAEVITRHGPWPARSVLALGAGLAEALEAIHSAGVVHRDLKPSNVLLSTDGPKVIDFGISLASEASALTIPGVRIGTPGFMSPEQLTGRPVGPASDVFALGSVLAYAATGVGPFGTGTPDALYFRAVHEQPDLNPLPPELRHVVAACLAKQPDQRPTVATLLQQLIAAGNGDGGRDTATSTLPLSHPGWMPDPVAQLVRKHASSPTVLKPQPSPSGDAADRAPGEQRWFFPTGDSVFWSPALDNGLVYINCRNQLYAVDADTGTQRWSFIAARRMSSSPTVANGIVYISSTGNKLYAVDADTGTQRWLFNVPGDGWLTSSPAVSNGIVYIKSMERLYAVDADTGTQRWAFTTAGGAHSSPTVASGVVYITGGRDKLHALDTDTGTQRWAFTAAGGMDFSPAVANGIVYISSKELYSRSKDSKLHALNADTGAQLWSLTIRNRVYASPTVANGLVHIGSHRIERRWGGRSALLYAVDAYTGVGRWSFTTAGGLHSSPTVANGVVYAGSDDHRLYAVDANTGTHRWSFTTGGEVYSSPTVANGVVYFGSTDNNLYSVQT
ncbi:PQQ-binding-like beta-propeller repeat protein [Streptomyces sp. NPDC093514]|uniref:serine/threonine-protein kinase n=1 Tax=Streptomyces sp. NPDC093514 TaxID=3366039 RepID=UPI0038084A7D